MNARTSVVVTSIAAPNDVLRSLAEGCASNGASFIVIGDVPSPENFQLEGCDFYSLKRQAGLDIKTARLVPERHYARKNIGYILAARSGAETVVETDDDNFPRAGFWVQREIRQTVPLVEDAGWVNAYRYFADCNIWPRGLPLDEVKTEPPDFEALRLSAVECPVQQGLADENPDVDAIYRLLLPLPISFRGDRRVALGRGSWCPFNSQNTTFFRQAFPLLYLPAYCSFRMTDIWRSFIAQRISWENGWSLLFHEPTVYQARNEHSLMRDFQDEVPGYLHNRRICEVLGALELKTGVGEIEGNLHRCYEELVREAILEAREMPLVEAWLSDLTGS